MTDARAQRIRVLFERALALPPAERSRWLDRMAGDDPAVVAEVRALLAADDEPVSALDATPAELLEAVRPPAAQSWEDRAVGPYRILRELGRGGMGTVYLAEREDVGLRVALKILAPGVGLASPDHVTRFLLERRLLARLEHPLIARLLDGGVMPDGTHWLAMELVDGEPITRLCDRVGMTVPARLQLFEAVCDAVSYAHRNLVVHRDLKPGNILVIESDGEWRPKLLDFGIAKLIREEEDAGDAVTRTGHWPLTPEYAAPEQLTGEGVTTATDVYALGVLLYELLVGRRPRGAEGRSRAAPIARPSAAVGRAREGDGARDGDGDGFARARGTTPDRLRRLLAGDLDNIVMKALEADPARRYESAAALGEDLRRYREERPVLARAPTPGYRVRKFMARNRMGVVAAGLVLASLLGGLGAATRYAAEASQARERAERALVTSEQVREFLISIFSGDPNDVWSTNVTLTELLEEGLRESERLRDQPVVQAQVLEEIGRVYQSRGEFGQAEDIFRRVLTVREAAIGPAAPATGTALRQLGDAVRRGLRYEEADSLYQRALSVLGGTVGEMHPSYADVLVGMANLAILRGDLQSALSLYERVLGIRRSAFGAEHASVAETLRLLAATRRRLGDYPEATALYADAVALRQRIHGPESTEAAMAMVHLADQHYPYNEDPAAAGPLLEEALRILRNRLGSGHPTLIHGLHSLAYLRDRTGAFEAGEELRRESLELVRRAYGDRSWRMAVELDMLGIHYRRRGEYDRSEQLHRQALELFDELYPRTHRNPLSVRANLAHLYLESGAYDKAEAMARRNLDLWIEAEGAQSPLTALERERLGEALFGQGRLQEAESQLRQALAVLEQQRGDGHRTVRRLLSRLVDLHQARGDSITAARYRARLADGRPGPPGGPAP